MMGYFLLMAVKGFFVIGVVIFVAWFLVFMIKEIIWIKNLK